MANNDYVSEILQRVSGDGDVAGDDDEIGLDDQTEQYIDGQVAGLVEIGALTEVGRRAAKKTIRKGILAGRGGSSPAANTQQGQQRPMANAQQNQQFSRSARDTLRRAPLGFSEDGTGKNYFSLPATIGATTTMRAKVSRPAHVDRLLIVPSGPGVVVDSIKVGDEEQCLAGGVPAELYGASALQDSQSDNFSPIGSGIDMIITLKNTTATAVTGTIGVKCSVQR